MQPDGQHRNYTTLTDVTASWASDRSAVRNEPALRKPPGAKRAVPIDDILAAMRDLERGENPIRSRQ
ncbi:MAG: hypothetical protein DI555_22980 [Novosphingobium pentaromativorans]|uniref:Uncharacterized protein n=1 Tax=Novosphingobium pentaromativorans TaxID=205844 RepID=A0A2W5N9Y4_9SPHN|nr:MAG: hypothetical protein DI555_22980 [Novosphingobium pentaromativorans]